MVKYLEKTFTSKVKTVMITLMVKFGSSSTPYCFCLLAVTVYVVNSFSAQDFVATSCRSLEYSSARTSNSLP